MRRIINSTYMSLDGGVQHIENWTFDYRGDDFGGFADEQLAGSDALLMGRVTYEASAAHWPDVTGDMADRMNGYPKYGVSDSITETPWNNTIVIPRRDAVARLRELKSEPGRDIVQYGYGPVTATLIEAGLLDELRIWVHPVLAGDTDATSLLAHPGVRSKLDLVDVARHDSGVVILSYRPT
jgi:dihydrofolate reductase